MPAPCSPRRLPPDPAPYAEFCAFILIAPLAVRHAALSADAAACHALLHRPPPSYAAQRRENIIGDVHPPPSRRLAAAANASAVVVTPVRCRPARRRRRQPCLMLSPRLKPGNMIRAAVRRQPRRGAAAYARIHGCPRPAPANASAPVMNTASRSAFIVKDRRDTRHRKKKKAYVEKSGARPQQNGRDSRYGKRTQRLPDSRGSWQRAAAFASATALSSSFAARLYRLSPLFFFCARPLIIFIHFRFQSEGAVYVQVVRCVQRCAASALKKVRYFAPRPAERQPRRRHFSAPPIAPSSISPLISRQVAFFVQRCRQRFLLLSPDGMILLCCHRPHVYCL